MRLPNSAHISRPWRIHELTHDFRLEDVWELPTPGGSDDFPRLVQAIASGDPSQGSSRSVRTLFAIRWKIGELLGWDGPDSSLGGVPDGTGGYHGQMAIYVKPNGPMGTAYMAAIKPFRHLIVYPPMIRQIGRTWRAGLVQHSG